MPFAALAQTGDPTHFAPAPSATSKSEDELTPDELTAPVDSFGDARGDTALGRYVVPVALPTNLPLRACSFEQRVCVRGSRAAAVTHALVLAEHYIATLGAQFGSDPTAQSDAAGPLEIVLRAHPAAAPILDRCPGVLGCRALHEGPYPFDDAPLVHPETYLLARDMRGGFDSAAYFIELPEEGEESPQFRLQVARELCKVAILRYAPAIDHASLYGMASSLAFTLVPEGRGLWAADAVYAAAHAWRAPGAAGATDDPFARDVLFGSSVVFFDWLDASYGKQPGKLLLSLAALGATKTRPAATRMLNEPDIFDVLRTTAKDVRFKQSKFDDLWLDYALDRVALSRHALASYPEAEAFRAAWVTQARTLADWDISYPDVPRRLLSAHPVESLGMSAVRIDLANRPKDKGVRAELAWEGFSRMQWAFLQIGADGAVVGRMPFVSAEKAVNAQSSLLDLNRASEVWLVGIQTGDPRAPFDPDDGYWESHAFTATVIPE